MTRAIQPRSIPEVEQLRMDFDNARQEMLEVEEALAQEQAAVNAFRMHCRLKIGNLVDQALELRTEKQRLITRLQLMRQAEELGIPYDEEDPFWQAEAEGLEAENEPTYDDLPMFTDTPQDKEAEKRLYRQLARQFHPDLATSSAERAFRTTIMAAINNAYKAQDIETLRDLAGELDPSMIVELNVHDSREIRTLRRRLLVCQRRKRRALQELQALRKESTAGLWQRAQRLAQEGRNWWDEVRLDLQREIGENQATVAALQQELAELEQQQADQAAG